MLQRLCAFARISAKPQVRSAEHSADDVVRVPYLEEAYTLGSSRGGDSRPAGYLCQAGGRKREHAEVRSLRDEARHVRHGARIQVMGAE